MAATSETCNILPSLAVWQHVRELVEREARIDFYNLLMATGKKKIPLFLTSQDAGQQKNLVLVGPSRQPATGHAEDEGLITTIISCQSQEHLVGLHGMGLWAVVIPR